MQLFIAGGSGFIGSALIRMLTGRRDVHIVNYDALTYAANPEAVEPAARASGQDDALHAPKPHDHDGGLARSPCRNVSQRMRDGIKTGGRSSTRSDRTTRPPACSLDRG